MGWVKHNLLEDVIEQIQEEWHEVWSEISPDADPPALDLEDWEDILRAENRREFLEKLGRLRAARMHRASEDTKPS